MPAEFGDSFTLDKGRHSGRPYFNSEAQTLYPTPYTLYLTPFCADIQCGVSVSKKHSNRRTADSLYASGPAVEADGYRFALDDDRNFASALRVFQHGVHMPGFFNHVIIFDLAAFFGKRFTSCPGVGSSILAENLNFLRHFFLRFNLGGSEIFINIFTNDCKELKKDCISLCGACQ